MRRLLLLLLSGLILACSDDTLHAKKPNIMVDPDSIDMGIVSLGMSSEKGFTITNTGDADLKISSILLGEIEHYSLSLDDEIYSEIVDEILIPSDDIIPVGIRFTPTVELDVETFISISHNVRREGVDDPIEIPVFGTGIGEPIPDIDVEPMSFDFGSVIVGLESQVTFSVSNVGNGYLLIDEVYMISAGGFVIEPPSLSGLVISPSMSEQMTVTFSPQLGLQYDAEIHISSNDPDESEVIITVTGIGVVEQGAEPVCDLQITSGASYNSTTGFWDTSPMTTVIFSAAGSSSVSYPASQLQFHWQLASRPSGSNAFLFPNMMSTVSPVLGTDLAGQYVVRLQVSDPDDQWSSPCQVTVNAIPGENLRVEMFWTQPDDMDLHLICCGGWTESSNDCYYSNMGPNWGQLSNSLDDPHLDLDDIPGTGPENINIVNPAAGSYVVQVRDYSGTVDYYYPNPTTVRIYLNAVLVRTYVSSGNSSTSNWGNSEGNYWKVATITWPSGAIVDAWQICSFGCP